MGKIVDWILEYAWVNEYLQHLETATLEGDIQDWVREKWERIFAEWKKVKAQGLDKAQEQNTDQSEDESADGNNGVLNWQDIHTPNIEAIETQGKRWSEVYVPEVHYPLVCKCATACSKIGRAFPTLSDLTLWPNTEKEGEAEPAEKEERELPEWETRAPENDFTEWEDTDEENEELAPGDDPTDYAWDFGAEEDLEADHEEKIVGTMEWDTLRDRHDALED